MPQQQKTVSRILRLSALAIPVFLMGSGGTFIEFRVTANSGLILRAGPGKGFAQITLLPKDSVVTQYHPFLGGAPDTPETAEKFRLLEAAGNEWEWVQAGPQRGWVSTDYIEVITYNPEPLDCDGIATDLASNNLDALLKKLPRPFCIMGPMGCGYSSTDKVIKMMFLDRGRIHWPKLKCWHNKKDKVYVIQHQRMGRPNCNLAQIQSMEFEVKHPSGPRKIQVWSLYELNPDCPTPLWKDSD